MAATLHRFRFVAVVVGLLAVGSGRAWAQSDFFNSSPGALSESHASIDGPDHCNDCHDNGREVFNAKCLGCHDHSDLKKRIDSGKGFHASSQVSGKQCSSCHNEHKGRGFDLMGWAAIPGGTKGFDHDVTGWKLEGKHVAVDCADCHKTKNRQGLRTYLGTDRLCGSCHKDDQPHGFDRREMLACERCHGQSVWNPPRNDQEFDHNDKKDASMPLQGSHVDVSCEKCHPKALFNLKGNNPDFCGNCHDSPHDGMLFGKRECEWCHSPAYGALDKFKFDHDKKTQFALGRAHAKMQCYDCHTQALGERKPDRTCEAAGCHADDNKHGDRFNAFGGDPPSCATCHLSSTTWVSGATNFNHDKKTKWKLTGRHDEVTCRACHRGRTAADFERFDAGSVGCRGCHEHKNVHPKEKYPDSQCLGCHQGAGKVDLKPATVDMYHGPRSPFPLVKGHDKKLVKCSQCHPNDSFKDTPAECGVRCHEDSLHKGSLKDECSRCHSPGIWEAVRFDHTDDTRWPLEGLHAKLNDCSDCHPTRAYTGTPKNCSADGCHAKDDVHKGRLGKGCERCHQVTGDNIFNHNTMSVFPLTGQHLTTKCAECHTSQTFKPRPTNCFGCHPEPDVHRGQYGTVCESCHSTQDWTDIQPLHDVGGFALVGAHDNLACARCHKDDRPMAGTGNLCINCHRQDDIHGNALTPRCGECHTQQAFAPARFDHTTVGCNLTGLHRTLSCNDCHRAGNYGAITAECVGCHLDDAGRAGHGPRPTCTGLGCHTPNKDWSSGQLDYGRESICR